MKYTRPVVDSDLRSRIFDDIMTRENIAIDFQRINDRQYGCILTDKNGVKRYCRLGVIVAEEREDMTAEELMTKEQAEYAEKQAKAAARAEEKAKKAEADKARREAKEKEEA